MIDQVRPNDLEAWIAAQGGNGVVLDVREVPELRGDPGVEVVGMDLVDHAQNRKRERWGKFKRRGATVSQGWAVV